ncbi:MAG TPA: amidase domain-containing protein [Firmicutes bacterium]|nr:amidase domain-containing protein [Bacillota bacterium]
MERDLPRPQLKTTRFLVVTKKGLFQAGLLFILAPGLFGLFGKVCFFLFPQIPAAVQMTDDEIHSFLQKTITLRDRIVLTGDLSLLDSLYDQETRYGRWACEHQIRKAQHLTAWAQKQGARFIDLQTFIRLRSSKSQKSGYSLVFLASTVYKYVYLDDPLTVNSFRLGAHHAMDIGYKDGKWVVSREWYPDPFASPPPRPKTAEIAKWQGCIQSRQARDFSNLHPRRVAAVAYANRYAGAAAPPGTGFAYNPDYKNYNYLGGDCTNYASQVLHEGGDFPKTPAWNYQTEGSKAWVNAGAFKDYMLYSGRSSLIAHGTYDKVLPASYELLPGDFIAYAQKGKVEHISIVTGADSRGYTLVNSHNADRYRVPWDLGWNTGKTEFWLVRVHY